MPEDPLRDAPERISAGSAELHGAGLGVETGAFAREEAFDEAAASHRPGREQVQGRGVDERDGVAERQRYVEVVRREEDALALVAGQPPQERGKLVAVREVEERRGFVEQDDGRVLRQRPGDHHALAFAVGHPVHRLAGEGAHADQFQRAVHGGAVGRLHPADPVGVGRAPQRHDVAAGEVGDPDLVGGDEADGPGPLPGRELRERAAAQLHAAPGDGSQSRDGPQQGALARAVAADQGGEGLRGEVGGDVLQQAAVAVGERDMS